MAAAAGPLPTAGRAVFYLRATESETCAKMHLKTAAKPANDDIIQWLSIRKMWFARVRFRPTPPALRDSSITREPEVRDELNSSMARCNRPGCEHARAIYQQLVLFRPQSQSRENAVKLARNEADGWLHNLCLLKKTAGRNKQVCNIGLSRGWSARRKACKRTVRIGNRVLVIANGSVQETPQHHCTKKKPPHSAPACLLGSWCRRFART